VNLDAILKGFIPYVFRVLAVIGPMQ